MLAHNTYMTDKPNKSLAAYLSSLRERAGMSLEQVAQAAGYKGRSSVQRYFEDDTIEALRPSVAQRLARALYDKGRPSIGVRDLGRLALGYEPSPADMSEPAIIRILGLEEVVYGDIYDGNQVEMFEFKRNEHLPVIGFAHASNWFERPENFESDRYLSFTFDSRNFEENEYAVRVVGPSVNRVAPDGTYAVCRGMRTDRGKVPSGTYVHVERSKGDFVEWTIKQIKWDAHGMLLCPDSTDPDHQEPIALGDNGHSIAILGVVIAWYRPA